MSFVIKDYPDKQLKDLVNEYYGAFVAQDIDRVMNCLAEDYHQDDYPTANIGLDRETYRKSCLRLFERATDMQIGCLSLQGSSKPGSVAALEWLMSFKLKTAGYGLQPGSQAGDTVTLVGVSLIACNKDGKVQHQCEHAQPMWPGFDMKIARKLI